VLHQLHISGLGVIDDVEIELHPGLNVLTGETGAGKTLVTVGLGLALGARAGAHLVGDGRAHARIQARFDAPAGADEWADDGELIMARTVGVDGKSTARVGGQLATASVASDLGARLLEIHGQHQSLRLLEPATQTAFLDRMAGPAHQEAVAELAASVTGLAALRRELDELTRSAMEREREADLLAYQVREIQTVAPASGESASLEREEARLGHVERLVELAARAAEALGGDGGATEILAGTTRDLDAAAQLDPDAADVAGRLVGLAAEAAELARDVRGYRDGLAVDPERLNEVRERMGALRGLHRKYGRTEDDVLRFLRGAIDRLARVTDADGRVASLAQRADILAAEVQGRARDVSAGRSAAAPRLARAVEAELHELGMPGAAVEVALVPVEPIGTVGAERAELRLAPVAGHPPRPVAKAASGGELSRIMLACRSVVADIDDVPTFVFDEVDAGIGGQAGLAVGRRLAHLAGARQVLVVTHLPQIAAFADRHFEVSKRAGVASVKQLGDDERIRELSRMLAGLESSDTAARHAEELLVEAARSKVAT